MSTDRETYKIEDFNLSISKLNNIKNSSFSESKECIIGYLYPLLLAYSFRGVRDKGNRSSQRLSRRFDIDPSSSKPSWLCDELATADDCQLIDLGKKAFLKHKNMKKMRRSNSTNTLYLKDEIDKFDNRQLLHCIAVVLHQLMENASNPKLSQNSEYELFNQMYPDSPPTYSTKVPVTSIDDIWNFLLKLSEKAQLESECIIMSIIYIEKFLECTKGLMPLRWYNWAALVVVCFMLASKVWDDFSMWNCDFSAICPFLDLKRLNKLESMFLNSVHFDVRITSSTYAKYYFKLQTMLDLPDDYITVYNSPVAVDKRIEEMKNSSIMNRGKSSDMDLIGKRKVSIPKVSLEEYISARKKSTH